LCQCYSGVFIELWKTSLQIPLALVLYALNSNACYIKPEGYFPLAFRAVLVKLLTFAPVFGYSKDSFEPLRREMTFRI
jgi:hypothetical protein